MKGSASQPLHNCRREEGKRSAQAGGMPSAGGVKGSEPTGRDPARGAGRSPQSPTAVRRDALSKSTHFIFGYRHQRRQSIQNNSDPP